MADQEIRLAARVDAVLEVLEAIQGVTIDALALIAMRDRDLLENMLRLRRLQHQGTASGSASAHMLQRYETAIAIADQLTAGAKLGPR